MKLLSIAIGLAAPFLIAASDAPAPITPDTMRAHIEFLAHDSLEGRGTGTRGFDIAAQYVATRLQSAGLQPAGTTGWFQSVPFVSVLVDDKASRLTIAGQDFINRKDVLFGPAKKAGKDMHEANVVFGGFCIHDPANGHNDLKGLDLKGKAVACLSGFPKGMKSDVGAHYSRAKWQVIEKQGGIGVLSIRTYEREARRPWAKDIEGPQEPIMGWAMPDGAMFDEAPGIRFAATLHDKAAAALFAGAPTPLKKILDAADKKGGRPKGFVLKHNVKLERVSTAQNVTSPNVIGMLPGSDPALANEYVLMMAHLDHNGVDETKTGDKIYNGAMDNASGTAALLEAARALAAGPRPRRPVLFVAVTAEERGLLGSDYLARHPVIKGGKVVAVVNLDMPVLLYDFQDVIAFGAEHSTMGPIVERAGAKMGITLSPDPMPAEGLFTRSDHYSFVKQGVPAIFLMTGFKNGGEKQFTDFLKTHYHKVSDDIKLPFDWKAAAKFAQLNTEIAREIADSTEAPKWYADSFFGKTFAPNAVKAAR